MFLSEVLVVLPTLRLTPYVTVPITDVRNVADTIVLMANMSLDANIQTVTVMATQMPFIGRG